MEMRLRTSTGDIGVEVKAPHKESVRPEPGDGVAIEWGDDADKVAECIRAANKQFDDCRPNILVLVPSLRLPLYAHRHDLVKAAYGETKITCPIDTRTGGPAGPVGVEFFPEGKFLNVKRPGGGALKSDGLPAHRRITAIVSIEEYMADKYPHPDERELLGDDHHERWPYWQRALDMHMGSENERWIEHNVIVVHNPYAKHKLPDDLFAEFPQFLPVAYEMAWSDGYDIDV